MKTMPRIGFIALLALSLLPGALAHRLDEYLQATLIGVTRDGIDLDIQLTPGVAILPAWMTLVDRDRDGRISPDEQRAYVARVIRDVELQVDGVPAPLQLVESTFPSVESMREGLGAVRIKLRTSLTGRRLRFENRHLPQFSVYLVNCLAAPSDGLDVTGQERDESQRSIQFSYSFAAAAISGPPRPFWPAAIAILLAARLALLLYRASHKQNATP